MALDFLKLLYTITVNRQAVLILIKVGGTIYCANAKTETLQCDDDDAIFTVKVIRSPSNILEVHPVLT